MKKIMKLVGSGLRKIQGLTLLCTLGFGNVFLIQPKTTLKISSKLCSHHICPLWLKKRTNTHREKFREVSSFNNIYL